MLKSHRSLKAKITKTLKLIYAGPKHFIQIWLMLVEPFRIILRKLLKTTTNPS